MWRRISACSGASHDPPELVRWRPDVILSDIAMPEEDGYSFIGRVRLLPGEQGGDTPAAALTAYAREEDRVQTLAAGYQMHLAKPIDPTHLVTMIARLAGSGIKDSRQWNDRLSGVTIRAS